MGHNDKSDRSEWLPFVIGLIDAFITSTKAKSASGEYRASEDRASWRTANATITMAAFTAAILVVGIFGFVVAWRQLNAMQGQLKVMEKTDRTTRESFTAVQRAFVFGKQLIVKYDTNIMAYWRFGVLITNSGNTPTKAMDYLALNGETPPTDPEIAFESTPKYVYGTPPSINQRRSGDLLGPHDDFVLITSEVGLPASVVSKMADDRKNYIFSGVIHYRDVFKDTTAHITKYCYVAVPYKDGKDVKISVQRCLYWNCADDDCEDDRERWDHDLAVMNPQLKKPAPQPPATPR